MNRTVTFHYIKIFKLNKTKLKKAFISTTIIRSRPYEIVIHRTETLKYLVSKNKLEFKQLILLDGKRFQYFFNDTISNFM